MTYHGPIIDVDVHHTWASPNDLLAYVAPRWRDALRDQGAALLRPAIMRVSPGGGGSNKRLDSAPETGPPGSSYDVLRDQVLDPLRIEHSVLCYDIGVEAGLTNPRLAAEMCRAANDWSIDRWLDGRDDRLHSAILVPTEQPEEAAKEIRRLAGHPRMVEVLLVANPLGKPFGHPIYDPIHRAAAEAGLPLAIHLGAEMFTNGTSSTAAAGMTQSRLDVFATFGQGAMHHASSLMTHGVLEKYPSLRVLIKEYGFTWVPWLMWRLDAQYANLRRENPLVKTLPSELFRERVIVSTQPLDHTDDPQQMVELVESFEGFEDMLVFSTDYPHWDFDDPVAVAARLPEEWHSRLFYDNAARFFGFAGAGT